MNKVVVNVVCPFCGKRNSVEVHPADWNKYMSGGRVQDCFPYLSPSDRELILTGICNKCWGGLCE